MRTIFILLIALSCAVVSASEPVPADETNRLVRDFRAKLAELRDLEAKFKGSLIGGGSLAELGQIGFILSQAGSSVRRRLNDDDRAFVDAAVRGQSQEELERNLPAIISYVRLSAFAGPMAAHARLQWPWLGTGRDLSTLVKLERDVAKFRARQYSRVRKERAAAAHVLTRSNLGPLGDAGTYRELQHAFRSGEHFRNMLRDVTGYGAFMISLAILSAAAVVLQRKAIAAYRLPSVIHSS